MAEAAAAASVQPSPRDLSLDVAFDDGADEPENFAPAPSPSSAPAPRPELRNLPDPWAPLESAAPQGSTEAPIELQPAAALATGRPARALSAPSAGLGEESGEAALRAALSQASREVIERVVWEVVPQLAEVILREHVEQLARGQTKPA